MRSPINAILTLWLASVQPLASIGLTKPRVQEDLEDTARGSWVLGYITAVNLFASGSSDVTQGREMKHIWAWIDVYCAEHPFDTIAVAAEALVSEFGQSSLSGRGQ